MVRALLSTSLQASLIEDHEDMSPLEYAILADAPMEVVELLQKATSMQSVIREKKPKFSNDAVDCTANDDGCRGIQRRRIGILSK